MSFQLNAAHIHLLINHLPVIGSLFGILFLIVGLGINSRDLKRASLWIFVFVALLAIPTFISGLSAEDLIEDLPGVTESVIENHEESAIVSLIAAGVLGIYALAGILLGRRNSILPSWYTPILIVLALGVGGLMARTAYLGGEIRHTEVRSGFKAPEKKSEPDESKNLELTPALQRTNAILLKCPLQSDISSAPSDIPAALVYL